MRLSTISVAALLLAAPSLAEAAGVVLAPHRAVYDLSFMRSDQSGGVEGARGRIVFEISGSACEGFASSFRQVVQMESSAAGSRLMDVRSTSFEDGEGKGYRFRIDRVINRAEQAPTEGRTRAEGDALAVQLARPKQEKIELPKDVLFPSFHTKALIEAAEAGQTTLSAKTYDGSDEGQAIYDTFAVIGRPIEHKADEPIEAAAKPLGTMKSWPVTISYYKGQDQTPAYIMSMELYENGVSRNLKLDYGSLALKGDMAQLELGKPAPACN